MKRDISQLYSRLGLRPGCTLDEFKHAYLRQIAELHPDHTNGAVGDANDLNELVWLYATASRFHRRHGRLPGAQVTEAPAPATRAASMARPVTLPSTDTGKAVQAKLAPARSENPLHAAALALPLVAVLLLIILSGDWLTPARQPDSVETAPANEQPQLRSLAPGMNETAVLALQGEPSERRRERWSYGPSWVQFEDGRVVDWYSAPQHPLVTAVGALAPGDVKLDSERR